jgi:hypothetical protein
MSFLLRQPVDSVHSLTAALCFVCFGLLTVLVLAIPARAAAIDDTVPSAEVIAQLEQRASTANPREQCFLYTELVHTMTEKAGQEIADGDTEQATKTLKQVGLYAHLIQQNIARNAKRLKDAEELMHHTTYRLAQVLHLAAPEDKAEVQATLKQLDQVNDELLSQVFAH